MKTYNRFNFTKHIDFSTPSDYEDELEELNTKFNIIDKYFPFNNVYGYVDQESGVNLFFDNYIRISGKIKGESLITIMEIEDSNYELDFHPHDTMGGFFIEKFENGVKHIFNNKIVMQDDKLKDKVDKFINEVSDYNRLGIIIDKLNNICLCEEPKAAIPLSLNKCVHCNKKLTLKR